MIQALMIQTDIEWKYLDDNRIFIIPIISIFDIIIMLDKNLFTMNVLSTNMLFDNIFSCKCNSSKPRPFSDSARREDSNDPHLDPCYGPKFQNIIEIFMKF